MKKIPTLFQHWPGNPGRSLVIARVTPGCEDILAGAGWATVKWDGSAVMVRDNRLYRRYDCRGGKQPPAGFEPCQDPDPATGHWPGWLPCQADNPADKHHLAAFALYNLPDGTYELIGPKFQGNPYAIQKPAFMPHGGERVPNAPRDYAGLREFLAYFPNEGLVWWDESGPRCKIKRRDFGLPWPDTLKAEKATQPARPWLRVCHVQHMEW